MSEIIKLTVAGVFIIFGLVVGTEAIRRAWYERKNNFSKRQLSD